MIACPFITERHPFQPAMERIRLALEQEPESTQRVTTPKRAVRQNELKGIRADDGTWRLARFYASAQSWNDSHRVPFSAMTYHWSDATAEGHWFEFPREPYLGALDYLADTIDPEILQYVVLRRLTFRAASEDGMPFIGKFKRRSRARAAFDVLSIVSDAVRQHPRSFRIPAPLSYDASRCLFHQEALAGRPVSELVNERTIGSLLFGVGQTLAELHELPVAPLPFSDNGARLATLAHDCAWISFFRPADGERLAVVLRALLAAAPTLGFDNDAMCHGDFVCSHVLYDSRGWAVVDFDLAHRGDAHADAAVLLSSLTHDVPVLHRAWRDSDQAPDALLEQAVAAFVEGYQSYGVRPLARRRLLWHRIAAEIHMLALMFTKDRLHAVAFDRSMDLIERLVRQLSMSAAGVA